MVRERIDYRKRGNWTTPLKAIRRHCLECCAGYQKMVRECHIYTCALWPYRLGHRPGKVEDRLYNFPDAQVFEIEDPEEATAYAGKVPADIPAGYAASVKKGPG